MDTMLKAVQGHETWVLAEGSHGHTGRRVAGRVFYGHAMRPDGLADPGRLKVSAAGPRREKADASLEEGKGDFHLAIFTPGQEGIWIVSVENDVGKLVLTRDGQYKRGTRRDYPDTQKAACHYQYAKTYIPVGHLEHGQGHGHGHHESHSHCGLHQHGHAHDHHHRGELSFLGHQLEIAALPVLCRKGDNVTVEVRYRGLPLLEAELCATWSFYESKDYPYRVKTDAGGRATVPLQAEGHWLFYVRHVDGQAGRAGEYEQKVYSATFTIFGVR